jgi:hypothetical protein
MTDWLMPWKFSWTHLSTNACQVSSMVRQTSAVICPRELLLNGCKLADNLIRGMVESLAGEVSRPFGWISTLISQGLIPEAKPGALLNQIAVQRGALEPCRLSDHGYQRISWNRSEDQHSGIRRKCLAGWSNTPVKSRAAKAPHPTWITTGEISYATIADDTISNQ